MRAFFANIILTCDSQMRIFRNAWLIVDENGIIVKITKSPPNDVEEKITFEHSLIMPGFVNTHTHVPMTILRGLKDDVDLKEWLEKYIFPAEAKLTADDIYWGSLHGIAEMLSSGITTFNDMYYFEERIADAVLKAGVRAMLSRGILDIAGDTEKAIKATKEFLDYVKKLWHTKEYSKNHIFFAYGPHAPYTCSKELLMKVREMANDTKFRIHIHLAETKWELTTFKEKHGKTPVEYLDSIGFLGPDVMAAHVVWTTDNDLEILAKRKVKVLHNPTSNLKLASGVARIPEMLEKGITVGLATDGPASNNRLNMFREMLIAALIHKGTKLDPKLMPAKTIVRLATIEGAKVLGLEKYIGSLEPGKFADFVVINLKTPHAIPFHDIYSMLVYTLERDSVEATYVGGKCVWKKDVGPTSYDIWKVCEKVQKIRERILT